MADETEDDIGRRQAERIRVHADRVDEEDDRSLFHRSIHAPQPLEYLTHEEMERHRRLIRAEPALSRLAAIETDLTARHATGKAMSLLGEIVKKGAAVIAAIIGALFLISEFLTRIAQ